MYILPHIFFPLCYSKDIAANLTTPRVWVLVTTCPVQTIESSDRGQRQLLANHRLRALLLTSDLSTHTMFSPYISAETSVSSFEIYPTTARQTITLFKCETEPWIFPKLFQETALEHVQIITEGALAGPRGEGAHKQKHAEFLHPGGA